MKKLRAEMKADCTVIAQFNHPEANAYYYSGTTEPFLAYITKDESVAFASEERKYAQFGEVLQIKQAKNFSERFFKKHKIKSIALDFSSEANRVGFKAMELGLKVENCSEKFDELRSLKEPQEQKLIKRAQAITVKTIEDADSEGQFSGRTENELAGFLEFQARKNGLALDSFPPIVSTGPKTAIPHGIPANDRLGDLVLVDCGASCEQYHADYTTTRYSGSNKKIKDAVEAVQEAKKAAERIANPGVDGKKLGEVAEQVIAEYGFADYSHKKIGLALGHSLGLKVHDGFRLEDVKLQRGMVFTIEPGIYVPNEFGIRFEDVVFL